MKIYVLFSGGKDSQACLIKAINDFGRDRVTALFCDTGWEHELTYKHVKDITELAKVPLITIRNESVQSFENLCKRMRWFPDAKHRMCTVQLKIQPTIDFILEQESDILLIQGIRAAESLQRSKLPCTADYFQEYKEKGGGRLYKKKEVRKWCSKYKCIVERPMLGESAQGVIDYILNSGQQPNPLYKKGLSRVGCFPCIYARLAEIKNVANDKYYADRLIRLEKEVNELKESKSVSSFFPKGKIPERFCKEYGNGIPSAKDVFEYVMRDERELNLFDTEEGQSCMSLFHGLCE